MSAYIHFSHTCGRSKISKVGMSTPERVTNLLFGIKMNWDPNLDTSTAYYTCKEMTSSEVIPMFLSSGS